MDVHTLCAFQNVSPVVDLWEADCVWVLVGEVGQGVAKGPRNWVGYKKYQRGRDGFWVDAGAREGDTWPLCSHEYTLSLLMGLVYTYLHDLQPSVPEFGCGSGER